MRIVPVVADLPMNQENAATAHEIALYYLKALGDMVDGKIHDIVCRPNAGDRAEVTAYPKGLDDEIEIAKYEATLYFPEDNALDRSWWHTLKLYGYERVLLIVTIDDGSK